MRLATLQTSEALAQRKGIPVDEKTLARFWEKVDKNGPVPGHCPEVGPCWIWTAYCDRDGYGKFGIGPDVRLAHRVSYTIATSDSPPPQLGVYHKCDNPGCVNPGHFFLGTRQDNSSDMVAKGRQAKGDRAGPRVRPRGERHGMAALSNEQAREILALYKGRRRGPTLEDLAKRFDTSRAVVASVVKGESYSTEHDGRTRTDERFKLSDDAVAEIRSLYRGPRSGPPTLEQLGKRFGVSAALVHQIVTGKSRKQPRDEPSGPDNQGSQR